MYLIIVIFNPKYLKKYDFLRQPSKIFYLITQKNITTNKQNVYLFSLLNRNKFYTFIFNLQL